jgi:hypothetical protein
VLGVLGAGDGRCRGGRIGSLEAPKGRRDVATGGARRQRRRRETRGDWRRSSPPRMGRRDRGLASGSSRCDALMSAAPPPLPGRDHSTRSFHGLRSPPMAASLHPWLHPDAPLGLKNAIEGQHAWSVLRILRLPCFTTSLGPLGRTGGTGGLVRLRECAEELLDFLWGGVVGEAGSDDAVLGVESHLLAEAE